MKTLKIHPSDNVAVLLEEAGGIPAGHKIALTDIAEGGKIIKYGEVIGTATCDIQSGDHVHTHNVKT